MKALDLAVIELNSTLGDLRRQGVRPLEPAAQTSPGEEVFTIEAPTGAIRWM